MYLQKHHKQNLFDRFFFKIPIILIAVFVSISILSVFDATRSLMINALSPVLKSGDHFYKSLSFSLKSFVDRDGLVEENRNLLNEIEKNRIGLADHESLKYENQKLREALKLKSSEKMIAASIIARPPQVPLDSLFLDKGSQDGLKEGDRVLVGERILVGKIAKLTQNRSTAVLNSFAGISSFAYVARTGEPLEIKGNGGGSIGAKVPIDFDVLIGDKMILGGSTVYLLAVVEMIETDQSSGFKNILLSLPTNISKINIVFLESSVSE